ADVRESAHGIHRGSALAPEGARVEDFAAVLRARWRGADDARANRVAARDHARARAADQRESVISSAPRESCKGVGIVSRVTCASLDHAGAKKFAPVFASGPI